MRRKFTKEEVITDMPLYTIFFVIGEGWYVANKLERKIVKITSSYLDALNLAELIG